MAEFAEQQNILESDLLNALGLLTDHREHTRDEAGD
jgi:hypothetical protein